MTWTPGGGDRPAAASLETRMIPVAVPGYFLGPRPRALVGVVRDWQIDQPMFISGAASASAAPFDERPAFLVEAVRA